VNSTKLLLGATVFPYSR